MEVGSLRRVILGSVVVKQTRGMLPVLVCARADDATTEIPQKTTPRMMLRPMNKESIKNV